MDANPRIITARKGTHLLADQTESLADLAARAHPRTTACGRKVSGMTGHHVAGDFQVECKSCQRTSLYRKIRKSLTQTG